MQQSSLTEAEFAALPLSIQRKYFSSLERLRIAEGSLAPESQVRRTPKRSVSLQDRSAWNVQRKKSMRGNDNARHRLTKTCSFQSDNFHNQAEARFYLSLPPKVQRQHFSREEQVLLAGQSGSNIQDTVEFAPSPGSEHYERPTRPSTSSFNTPSSGVTAVSVNSSSPGPKDISFDLEEEEEESDDMPSQESPTGRSRRSSFRNLSITAPQLPQIPFSRQSTSSVPSVPASPSFRPNTSRSRTNSTTVHFPRPSFTGPRPSFSGRRPSISAGSAFAGIDPGARYYQDPETRRTLKYLATPHKFDEAVEFGFPSQEKESSFEELPMPQFSRRNSSRDLAAFLRDDRVSFLDSEINFDDSSDEDSVPEVDSPTTPAEADELFRHTRNQPSIGFSTLDPISRTREMTLRMTLTRPDLRADDEALYGWQENQNKIHDPLALEALPPVTDDHTGAHGAFAAGGRQSGLVKKIISKVKGNRR